MRKFLVTLIETTKKEWQIEVQASNANEAKNLVRTGKVDYLDGMEQDEESDIEIQYADELEEV